jgi:2-polyprenyl-6-methoxyphenol hydroxylase-like FAD-dependent oxidoreductase
VYEAPRAGADIVVIGGGIGRIAAAAFHRRVGHQVRVYEQARAFGAVGAGLAIPPNAVRLIRRLGVLLVLERAAVPVLNQGPATHLFPGRASPNRLKRTYAAA